MSGITETAQRLSGTPPESRTLTCTTTATATGEARTAARPIPTARSRNGWMSVTPTPIIIRPMIKHPRSTRTPLTRTPRKPLPVRIRDSSTILIKTWRIWSRRIKSSIQHGSTAYPPSTMTEVPRPSNRFTQRPKNRSTKSVGKSPRSNMNMLRTSLTPPLK